jgi:hypothetical protein
MIRTLYHGSKDRIVKPLFGAGKPNNDYGLGFYCTESEELAKEWAVAKDHDGWANVYSLDDDGLNVLNLNSDQYCILHWLAVLLANRQFETEYGLPSEAKSYLTTRFAVPYKEADAIIGYRADDSYFTFARNFLSGAITFTKLGEAMRLGKLGTQFVLKSRKAFSRIEFKEATLAKASDWFALKKGRDDEARRIYRDMRAKRERNGLYITRIMDEEMTADDLRV